MPPELNRYGFNVTNRMGRNSKIMNSNLRFFLIIFLLSVPITFYAQHDFRDGYVITNDNDTLYGEIDFRDYGSNSRFCHFRKSMNDSLIIYKPGDIQAYRIIDDKYYVTKTVETQNAQKDLFLEYLIKGEVNIYYYRDQLGDHYLIDKIGSPLKEVVYKEEKIVIDHVTRLRESTKHIGILEAYMSDCPEIFYDIESIKKPDHDNMIALAKEYHQKICNNDSCIIYSKKKSPVRIAVEPTIGFFRYKYGDKFYMGKGIIIHFWLPRSSERLYIKTGYQYSKMILDTENNEEGLPVGIELLSHKIPIQLEYVFPGKILQPRLSYGINYYITEDNDQGYLQTCGAGTNIKIYNDLFLSLGIEAEWRPILAAIVMDYKIEGVSCSLNMGIYYRF